MNTEVQEPRFAAALGCYALAKRRRPGSLEADAAELAAVYCLSERRRLANPDELMQAALHDGWRTTTRARRSHERISRELTYLSLEGIDTAGARAVSGIDRTEQTVLARDLLGELRRYADELGHPAPRVFAGLLVGESESETALAACTSRSTVTRTRRALREHATSVGCLPAAA